MQLKGLLHVHSRASYDGEHSLEELLLFARSRGYRFFCMTEHTDTMTETTLADFVARCRHLSSPECLLIPGLEFTTRGGLHVMGFGIRRLTSFTDPVEVCNFINGEGCLSVLAHPCRQKYHVPAGVAQSLSGIEIWNSRYDGRFLPNARSLRLLFSLRSQNPSLLAFGGQDLHRITTSTQIHTVLLTASLSEEGIIHALRVGDFAATNSLLRVEAGISTRRPSTSVRLLLLGCAHAGYTYARAVRNRLS